MPAAEQQWPSSASAVRPLLSPSHVPFLPPQTPRSSQPPSRTPRSRRTSAAAERPASTAQPLHTPRTRPQSAGPIGAASDVGYEPDGDPASGWTRPVSASGLRPTIIARKAPTWGPGSPRRGGSRGQPAVAWATSGEVRKARCAAQLQRLIVDSDAAEQQLRLQLYLLLSHADAGAVAGAGAGVGVGMGVAHPPGPPTAGFVLGVDGAWQWVPPATAGLPEPPSTAEPPDRPSMPPTLPELPPPPPPPPALPERPPPSAALPEALLPPDASPLLPPPPPCPSCPTPVPVCSQPELPTPPDEPPLPPAAPPHYPPAPPRPSPPSPPSPPPAADPRHTPDEPPTPPSPVPLPRPPPVRPISLPPAVEWEGLVSGEVEDPLVGDVPPPPPPRPPRAPLPPPPPPPPPALPEQPDSTGPATQPELPLPPPLPPRSNAAIAADQGVEDVLLAVPPHQPPHLPPPPPVPPPLLLPVASQPERPTPLLAPDDLRCLPAFPPPLTPPHKPPVPTAPKRSRDLDWLDRMDGLIGSDGQVYRPAPPPPPPQPGPRQTDRYFRTKAAWEDAVPARRPPAPSEYLDYRVPGAWRGSSIPPKRPHLAFGSRASPVPARPLPPKQPSPTRPAPRAASAAEGWRQLRPGSAQKRHEAGLIDAPRIQCIESL